MSHRGGLPGFVRITQHGDGPTVLHIPDYRGNQFFNTLGNLAAEPTRRPAVHRPRQRRPAATHWPRRSAVGRRRGPRNQLHRRQRRVARWRTAAAMVGARVLAASDGVTPTRLPGPHPGASLAGSHPLRRPRHGHQPTLFAQGPHRPRHRRLARHRPHDRGGLSGAGRKRLHLGAQGRGLRPTATELSAIGPCISLPADVSSAGRRARPGRRPICKRETQLDILVNNAGAAWGADFDEFPESGWDKVVDLNMKTPFFLTQALHAAAAKARRSAPGQGDQHRLDRRHRGQSAWRPTPTPPARPA